MLYYNLEASEVVKELNTSAKQGLSQNEAKARLKKFGLNQITEKKEMPIIFRFFSYFTDLMAIILIAAAVISFLVGSRRDGFVILGIVFLNAVIGFFQEYRAEKAIEALKKLVPKKALVIRDGRKQEILSEEVVPGDILVLQEGEDIAADSRVIEEFEIQTNDFSLTGESLPQKKSADVIYKKNLPITDITNMVFMGTQMSSGNGLAVVVLTGMGTEFGKIAQFTQEVKEEPSPLQKELFQTGKIVTRLALIVAIGVFLINFFLKRGFSESLIFAIGISVAVVPEGLPATVSVALALGTQRMAKRKALIRKLSAVETLGSTTVICTDKTGTLTKNEMTVKEIWFENKEIHVEGVGYDPTGEFILGVKVLEKKDFNKLLPLFYTGILCNDAELRQDKRWFIFGDPTEGSLLVLAQKAGLVPQKIQENNKRIFEFSFSSERKRMTVICRDQKGRIKAYSKGSPELILERSSYILVDGKVQNLTSNQKKEILTKIDSYANEALRVLAFAYRDLDQENFSEADEEKIEKDLVFLGLTGIIDPPREEVFQAIKDCQKAKIKVIMITGDYELTAKAIAKRIGLEDSYEVITGEQLNQISDSQVLDLLKKGAIFARTDPEHKLRIVSLLKEKGEVVAVTGDGVNDAPALKKADIGVAMGITGTDVSREASEMVLLDDSFASIVAAIKEGREVYDNLKKFVYYIFSSNMTELFTVVFGMILNLPFPIIAIQILAIDLGTDVLPSLALAVDPPEEEVMTRPPRDQKERLLNKKMLGRLFFVGIWVGLGAVLAFLFIITKNGWFWGKELAKFNPLYLKATALTYTCLVLSQVVNVFHSRDVKRSIFKMNPLANKYLVLSILGSLTLLWSFLNIPLFQGFLHTKPLGKLEISLALGVALSFLFAEEIRKFFARKRL